MKKYCVPSANCNRSKKRPVCPSPRSDINRRMSIGEAKARRAKKEMVEANLRLVISIAKVHQPRSAVPWINPGGQHRSDRRRSTSSNIVAGYKFSTYAHLVDPSGHYRSIADQARTIRIPVHMIETINKLNHLPPDVAGDGS